MNNRPTRSDTDFTNMTFDSLDLPVKKEKPRGDSTNNGEDIIDLNETTTTNNVNSELNKRLKGMEGHDLDDHPDLQLGIEKFSGQGDVEQWLKHILEKFDYFQIPSSERKNLIPNILTGEALIWYFKQQSCMSTFNLFIQRILYYYGGTKINQERLPLFTSPLNQMKQQPIIDYKESIMESLRNQMLINSLEKLPKFSGRSKQNVSKWLREIQQAMHIFKLTDDEKLFFIPLCLENDARDWFFDNDYLFPTWSLFIQKLNKTFESPVKAEVAFNRLRHYKQGLNQDVREYYFEVMKLCKEANPVMDEFTRLQHLKDGLKPSLRFGVILKDPKTLEEFLEYAQRVEALKSLDEKEEVLDWNTKQLSRIPLKPNTHDRIIASSQPVKSFLPPQRENIDNQRWNQKDNSFNQHENITTIQDQPVNHIPRAPYRCYECGATDHFEFKCPHFQ